ncbi:MAG: ASKHA domain-containing protein [Oscillospiraceae bacterium]|nr:ASKHA domain-containing protein [Oscillospiraceae bacterium]
MCPIRCYLKKNAPIAQNYLALHEDFVPREGFGLAVDLGTTTVAMQCIDLQTGQVIDSCGFANPQRQFGADVISRIDAANHGQLSKLQSCIRVALEQHTAELLQGRTLAQVVISGNTTMIYTLLGYNCNCLGVVPFVPATPLQNPYMWQGVPVFIIPWISAFVGGDVVSGLLSIPRENTCLLVDLGTNGEIALCRAGELYATSTAAGPAFEGMRPGVYGSQVLAMAANGQLEPREMAQVQLAKSAVRTGIEILLDLAGRPDIDTVYLCGGMGQAMREDDALTIGLFPSEFKGKIVPAGNTSLGGTVRLLRNPAAMNQLPAITAAQHINLAEQPQFNTYFMEYLADE